MNVEIKKLENSNVELLVTVEGDLVRKNRATVINKIAKEVELPGFRKGKAPISTIEAKFKDEIKDDVADLLIKEQYDAIIKEHDLKPVDFLRTVSIDLTDDKFVGTFVVDVYPEIKLGEYKGLEVEREEFKMDDVLLSVELDAMVEKNSKLVEAGEGYAAQLEDTVVLNFEGFVDGEPFEGGKAEGYTLKIGSKSFIDTFEEQLVGYQVGQEGEVNVKFPNEYFKDELAGKSAIFKVKVTAVKKLERPALDDEFAKDNDFDSLEALKESKREEIIKRENDRIDAEYKNAVVTKAVENSELTIPVSMIDREVENRIREIEYNLKMQGASLDMYLQMSGLSMEALGGQLKSVAESKVKRDVVLDAIATAENISVSDEELDKKVEDVAAAYGMEVEKLKEELTKAGNLNHFMENLKIDIRIHKTVDILVENTK